MKNDISRQSSKVAIDFSIFEATPGMRFIFLPDAPHFTIAAASRDICNHLNINKEQLIGKGLFEAFPSNHEEPADTGEIWLRSSLQHVLQHKEPHQLPLQRYDVKEKCGRFTKRYWKADNFPFCNSEGDLIHIIHTTEDVTHLVAGNEKNDCQLDYYDSAAKADYLNTSLRQTEERKGESHKRAEPETTGLRQQQVLFASILDASFNGIYALKAQRDAAGAVIDFNYLFANNKMAGMLKTSVTGIVGKSMLELIPENKTNGFFDLFCQVLQTGKTVQDETFFKAKNLHHWFDYIIVPIDNDTVVVTIHDITEQKRATDEIKKQKELLDSVVDNASSALLYCQSIRDEKGSISDFKIVLANDEAADMSGFSGATDFSSFTITQVLKTIGAEDIIPIYVEVVETGKKHSFEYYIGSLCRWYYISVVKVGDGFLATCTNIEQTKLLQLQLEKTVEELKQSNQNLEEFAYAASHDMKEPIRKIRTFSDRLKMNLHGRLLDQDKYYLERMENATERMRILIDDLLDYSQVSLSEDYSEEVDLNAQVTQVLEDVELEIAEKNADIIVGSLPIIKGNRRQTLQLFQNLLTNALKFNKPGMAPQIRISSSLINGIDIQCLQPLEQSDNKLYHQIIISDSGIGFEQEYADKIFKMFKRLHGKAEYAGTGIGLAIVRKVVDNHKGYITAESKPGEGAAFKIFLPAE